MSYSKSDGLWLLPFLNRATKKELLAMLDAMPARYRRMAPAALPTNPDKRAFIQRARARYWDDQQTAHDHHELHPDRHQAAHDQRELHPDRHQAAPKHARTSLCTITASECNAWLRSLPPLNPGYEPKD